ncbi:MAG: hypothetical protein ACOX3T_06965 [Bdellovibrionota bacterium]
MKKFITISLLMFCYISLSAAKGCREDYVILKQATPTPTETVEPTETIDDDIDDDIDEDVNDDTEDIDDATSSDGIVVDDDENNTNDSNNDGNDEDEAQTEAIIKSTFRKNSNKEDSNKEDLNKEDNDDSEDVKANVDMNDLLAELETLSEETKDLNWLGRAFIDKDNDSGSNEENDDIDFVDSDNDGYSDILELELDTNPHSSASFPYVAKTRLHDRISQDLINEVLSSSANAKDTNNDGLNDELERLLGTNPFALDTDNDGISDYREFINGTDPLIREF